MIADYKITSFSVLFPSHNRSVVDCVTGIKTAFQQLEDESCLKKAHIVTLTRRASEYSLGGTPTPYSLSNLLQRPKAQERSIVAISILLINLVDGTSLCRCRRSPISNLSACRVPASRPLSPAACLPGAPGTWHLAPGTCTVPLQTRVEGRADLQRPKTNKLSLAWRSCRLTAGRMHATRYGALGSSRLDGRNLNYCY